MNSVAKQILKDSIPEKPKASQTTPPVKQVLKENIPDHPKTMPTTLPILLFNKWDISGVKIGDPGVRKYMSLVPFVVPRTDGRFTTKRKYKERMNIVERFMNKLMVPGHRGKKHKLTSRQCTGKAERLFNTTIEAFEIIEKRLNKNPFQVFVEAIEKSSVLEEVANYRLGGIIARKSVIVSPARRVDLALRFLTQGIQRSAFHNKKHLAEVIADEIIAVASGDPKSSAIQEKNRLEKEAEGAR